jgi:hypothetical protein
VKHKGVGIMLEAALWAQLLSPVRAFDSVDFPIRVYVNPYIAGTEKSANLVPVRENKQLKNLLDKGCK